MKKLIIIILIAVCSTSCMFSWLTGGPDPVIYNYYFNITNHTQQNITLKLTGLMHQFDEVESKISENGSLVIKSGEVMTLQGGAYDSNESDQTFHNLWVYAMRKEILHKTIKFEVWTADTTQMLKRWTLAELESNSLDVSKKHFFREEDWERKGNPTKGDCTWTFILTDEDLK